MFVKSMEDLILMKDDNMKEDKVRALDAAIGRIEKQYGKGSVMKLGDSVQPI